KCYNATDMQDSCITTTHDDIPIKLCCCASSLCNVETEPPPTEMTIAERWKDLERRAELARIEEVERRKEVARLAGETQKTEAERRKEAVRLREEEKKKAANMIKEFMRLRGERRME
ncbi:hypothetical protein PENTCL1PPCAC_21087, partial [Pristionchus entomophagus]